MKNSYFILIIFLCSINSFAQVNTSPPPSIMWQKTLGGSSQEIYGDAKQTSDGGYIVAGYTSSNDGDVSGNHTNGDAWVAKLDNTGTLQWQKCLGGSGNDIANSIEQTSDGGYIVAGSTSSNNGDVSGNHDITGSFSDYWIVKLSSAGVIEWQKCLGGGFDDLANAIKQTADGGYIIAGSTFSNNDGDVTGNHTTNGSQSDYWIVKINSTGTIEWQKAFGGTFSEDARSVVQTSDGGYIVAGLAYSSNGDVTKVHGADEDYWIVKLSTAGILEWQNTYGGTVADEASGVVQTAEGGYIVTGTSNSNDGDVSGNHGGNDYWVLKLSNSGVITWQKSLGGTVEDRATSIKQTSDNGYIVAGYAFSNDGDVSGNNGSGDYWIVKLSNDGTFQWQKCFGGSGFDAAKSIDETNDGGYIIQGSSESNNIDVSGNHGNGDLWLLKLNTDILLPVTLINFSIERKDKQNLLHWATASEHNCAGFEIERSNNGSTFNKIGFVNTRATNGNSSYEIPYNFADAYTSDPVNYYRLKQLDKGNMFTYSNVVELKNTNASSVESAVYPNPAKNVLNVRLTSPVNSKITVSITDLNGRLIFKKIATAYNGENVFPVDVARLLHGNYYLKITGISNNKLVHKFSKQ